ncbi:MAG: glycosyltransferase family 4 protein [Actinomycetota bacterium]|jgi:glycosyltransferase involved in cell wall biosynthesis|nr:glycosyltransferase family 4 protein [Actinomycetota bacterium]
MRIVMLLHNPMVRDARVQREATALAQAGHQVTVLALMEEGLPATEDRDGFRVHRVAQATTASIRRPLSKIQQARARSRAMVDAAVALNPDVVHCHDTDTVAAGHAAAGRVGARLVYDAHELYPDMAIPGRMRAFIRRAYWLRVERSHMPYVDATVTVSDGLAAVLHDRYSVDSVVVRNVPRLRPLDNCIVLREEYGIDTDAVVLICQGVLNEGRGLPQLLDAMRLVCSRAVLIVQGDGRIRERMQARVSELGIEDRVKFTGFVPMADLHAYACGADIGVAIYENASLNNYLSLPNKLFAYLMAGLAVVSSDFPGLSSVVRSRGIGETFDPASPQSIAEAITALVEDETRRKGAGGRARVLAETEFNWEIESRRLLDLYERFAQARD